MKIAVCYAGQLRTGPKTIENHKRYFGDLDVDVFIHTWFTNKQKFAESPIEPVSAEELASFVGAHQAKSIKVERQENYERYVYEQNPVIWYTFQEAIKLKRDYEQLNGFTYDVVMKLRPDMIFPADEQLEKHLNVNFQQAIFIPNIGPSWRKERFVDDCMCFGPSTVMDVASHYHDELDVRSKEGRSIFNLYMMRKGFIVNTFFTRYTIYRPTCLHLSPMTDFDACVKCDQKFCTDAVNSYL